jgi:hypothetical protein
MWDQWIYATNEDRPGDGDFHCFVPIEFDEEGHVSFVTGMNLGTTLEEIKGRATRVYEIDDLYDPQVPARVVWDASNVYSTKGEK